MSPTKDGSYVEKSFDASSNDEGDDDEGFDDDDESGNEAEKKGSALQSGDEDLKQWLTY